MTWIDLRSDTVTRPTPAMRAAMLSAEVGDDVYGEDPTVNVLEARLAAELGFESGLFLPSGTQSNLVAVMAHCERGDEYLVGMDAHTYKFEGGGAAVLGSIQPQPIPHAPDGTLSLEALAAAVKPLDVHFARTRLLCLENTWHGRALPLEYLAAARAFCTQRGLAMHLDGARLFNAAIACGVTPRAIAAHFDSVSVCFSKGLGAPVGAVLVGTRALIDRARRWRKVAGGGMRQAGILAAACLYALDHHVERLAEDHARAARLAAVVQELWPDAFPEPYGGTNLVVFRPPDAVGLLEHLASRGVRAGTIAPGVVRLATHAGIDDAALAVAIDALRSAPAVAA